MAEKTPRTVEDIELKLPKGETTLRPVKTVYYFGREVVRVTRSVRPLRATGRSLERLRENKYAATHCEVYNIVTGDLYAVQKRNVNGHVHTLFQFDYKPGE